MNAAVAERSLNAAGMVSPHGSRVLSPSLHQRWDRIRRHWSAGADSRDGHALRMVVYPDERIGWQAAKGCGRSAAQLAVGAGLLQVQEGVASSVGDLGHADFAVLVADAVAV